MNRLIIIAGASGAGKSFLLENIYERYPEIIEPIKKLSTRVKRNYEQQHDSFVDLIFNVNIDIVNQCEYHYPYENDSYGIEKEDIDYILDRGKSPIVIIRHSSTVKQLKRDYPDSLTIFTQSILSGQDLTTKLNELGRDDIDISKRERRIRQDFLDFCNNADLYDYVLLNDFDISRFLSQFDKYISKESKKHQTSKQITFISGNNFNDKYNQVANCLTSSNYRHYKLAKLSEFSNNQIIAESVQEKLLQMDFVIVDLDCKESHNEALYYYIGFLKANNIPFDCIIPESNIKIISNNFNVTMYNEYTFVDIIKISFINNLRILRQKKQSAKITHLMKETIKEAKKSTFEDNIPRPNVGAILVDSNFEVITRAYRGGDESNGQHAEFRLFESIKDRVDLNLESCTLFVTLEPCTTRNLPKTPCAERVIQSGVKTVFVGMLDPDIRIRGIGVTKMKENGIKVDMFPSEIENEIREINAEWIQYIKEKDYK